MTVPPFPRWLYYDPSSPEEGVHHQTLLKKIDAWWHTFAANTQRLHDLFHNKAKWNLPDWMEQHLQGIHPQLMWEFGPAVKGEGHRLVITPESARFLRPLTDTIMSRAPQIKGWEFYGFRLPEDLESTQRTVEARTRGDITEVLFQAQVGDHNLVDLTYFSPRTEDANDQQANHDAFVATETLVGEEWLEKWIGGIDVAPLTGDRPKASLLPLDRLRERVESLINHMQEQLSAAPFYQSIDQMEWSLFELKPEQAEDYPAQCDMFVGKSPSPSLWIAAHSRPAFFSDRFSKWGETFCYVKVDGTEGLDEEKFADKGAIEDALDEILRPAGLGCQIGGGTGLRYSYIDLALTDRDKGIEVVRRRLREGNVPRRSWIQFFDTYLVGEWIGIYADSPPPPMEEGE